MNIDTNSIAHTTWNCKYHIVFAPKYRRQIIYGKIKGDIGQIILEGKRKTLSCASRERLKSRIRNC